jgi:hypothetical protein
MLRQLRIPALLAQCLWISNAHAVDSYRYLHVTVDTPWNIFLFLLIGIFAPFILMGVLAWYFSFKKKPEPPNPPSSPEDHP